MNRLQDSYQGLVPLLLRLPLAAVFLFAGWPKITNLAGAAALFEQFGLPGFIGYVAALLEVVGGAALLLGLGTRLLGLLFAIEMVIAIAVVNWGQATAGPAFDYNMIRLQILAAFACFALVITGGGSVALDRLLQRR